MTADHRPEGVDTGSDDANLSRVISALVRLSGRVTGREEFFRETAALLMELTGATSVRLWLEEGPTVWRCSATGWPAMSLSVATSVRETDTADDLMSRAVADGGGAGVVLPFAISVGNRGVLQLVGGPTPDRQRLAALASLAEGLGAAVAARRANVALKERVKELTCMYRIAQIGSEAHLPLADLLQQIAELLPEAWQVPAQTCARVTLGDEVYTSPGFRPSDHGLAAEVLVRGARRGGVEVFYAPERGEHDPGDPAGLWPFLAEERHLIDGVAREIGFIVERRWFDEENDRLRMQLRHADRLATIGQLAAGVAHELNEPLANILGFAQLLEAQPEVGDRARGDVRQIVTASLYAREVIRKLMLFARQTPPQRGRVDVNGVVADALALVESRCQRSGIEVQRSLSADLPPLVGDAAQIQQVVVNLLVNAIQAMPAGGRLQVTTESRPAGTAILINDSGVGIPPEDLDKIFLPFFTTKEVGHGTGLGLAVVHGIVSAHRGTVTVTSRLDQGTRVEVVLPAQEAPGHGG